MLITPLLKNVSLNVAAVAAAAAAAAGPAVFADR